MRDQPAPTDCGDCHNGRLCDTLRRLTARDLSNYTVTEIAQLAIAHSLDEEGVGLLLAS